MAPITILHVSDLHRDLAHEITNQALLDSLERDRDRYRVERPAIPDPDLIIVSGDIVHGVAPGAVNAEAELDRQYEQAEEFLAGLSDSFVGGDRERVVVIPGNHDVSYFHTLRSMKQVAVILTSQKGKEAAIGNARRLWSPNSSLRWSWGEFCFYEITDPDAYAARLAAFCKFYARFYSGRRPYNLKADEQYDIFDYPRYNVTIVGLSSCHGNDPINKRGAIHPDCIAAASRRLREARYRGRLLLATWHHNTSGGPDQSDYMDADELQVFIDDGFSIGFHGHQHKPQFIDERHQFGTDRKITVVSAGTLCAGPGELPTGHARAYNLVQIDQDGWKGVLHQRRMQNENFGRPIWGPGFFPSSGKSFVEFSVQRPPVRETRAVDAAALGEAEKLIRAGQRRAAADLLRPLMPGNLLARRLLLECYSLEKDPPTIIDAFFPPETNGEIVEVADALWEEGDHVRLRAVLESDPVRNASDAAVIEIRNRYLPRLK